MVSFADMTEADLARADQVFGYALMLVEDILANPPVLEDVPSPSTIELFPLAEAIGDDDIVARTQRFAVKVV